MTRMNYFQAKRLLSSTLTCSQGIPSCGLASKSASRRSSSAPCACVRSGSLPSSAMKSQKSWASLILSSFGRAFAASRISVAFISPIYRDGFELQVDIRTCSHGIPLSGLRLNRSARRSASAICSGGNPSSKSPNSSNIWTATSRRSFSGKRRICSKISAALTSPIYRDGLNLQADSARANAGLVSHYGRAEFVAQVSNLLYRRLPVGRCRRDRAAADWKSAIRQTRSLRYKNRDVRANPLFHPSL
jgi:hypothetical protein